MPQRVSDLRIVVPASFPNGPGYGAAAQVRQAEADVGAIVGIGVGAGRIIDAQGRFAARRLEVDFAHGNADVGVVGRGHVHLAAATDRAGGDARRRATLIACFATSKMKPLHALAYKRAM